MKDTKTQVKDREEEPLSPGLVRRKRKEPKRRKAGLLDAVEIIEKLDMTNKVNNFWDIAITDPFRPN